jgi:nucleotide sugar dehydrogenase
MTFESVGIIGIGFVGKAIRQFFQSRLPVHTYDIDSSLASCQSIEELMSKTNMVFVSVPTPMNEFGACDTSIIEIVLADIAECASPDAVIILKSTIPPGTTDALQQQYPNLTLVFSPEFLTEANAVLDFQNQNRILLGTRWYRQDIYNFFDKHFTVARTVFCTAKQAELAKYATNTFLAVKVIFANELAALADSLDIDYMAVVELLKLDSRLGTSHWRVPGPDGKVGYGGTCFPKDTAALLTVAYDRHVELSVIAAAWKKNVQLRPERDWELLKGRAVVA